MSTTVPISSWSAVPVMAAMPTILQFLGSFTMPPGNIHANGDGEELLQLAQAAELAQHDLAEHQLAGGGAQGGGKRVKQHGQRQGDEQEVLHRELHNAHLEAGNQLGEQGGQAVQGHGQHKHHQFLGLGRGLLFCRVPCHSSSLFLQFRFLTALL